MTREDITRMAREAGGIDEPEPDSPGVCFLERFADLVAAAEREACARVCDEQQELVGAEMCCVAMNCGTAIRARGATKQQEETNT